MPFKSVILSPAEAIPIIMDRSRSPVVAIDTEFDGSVPTCRAPLHGVSIAGGTPEAGFVGAFWPFRKDMQEAQPWQVLRDTVVV